MKTCKGYWPDAGDPDHGYYASRSLDPRWDWVDVRHRMSTVCHFMPAAELVRLKTPA